MKGLVQNEPAWYRNEVTFSNWRDIGRVDYSTNVTVGDWYSGGHSKYYRPMNAKQFGKDVTTKDTTITLAIDYYAFYYVTGWAFDSALLPRYYDRLRAGQVIRLKFQRKDSLVIVTEY